MPIRAFIIALAGALSFASVWLVGAESLRHSPDYFPRNAAEAQSFVSGARSAGVASSVGWPRGDLASDNAVAVYAEWLIRANADTAGAAKGKATSLAAIHLAPYDARPWVTLAAQDNESSRRQQILKMSYYTAPASVDLFPQRFRLAATRQPIDDELKTLLEFEIGILLRQNDGFEADLANIYRASSDSERGLLERLINTAAPSVLAKLKSPTR